MSRAAEGSEATAQLLEAAERREHAAAEKAAAHAEEAAAHSQALTLLRDEHRGATEGLTMCVSSLPFSLRRRSISDRYA